MDSLLTFGAELRHCRQATGMTLRAFARRVAYDPGHLSRVENDVARPSMKLVERCEEVLGTGGRLRDRADETWGEALAGAGSRREGLGRRSLLAVGGGSLLAFGLTSAAYSLPADDTRSAINLLQAELAHKRKLGQRTAPGLILPLLIPQTASVVGLADSLAGGDRRCLLVLGSHYADFTGWMAQENGDNHGALYWTRIAGRLAEAGGNPDLVAYANVRSGLLALYAGDARRTVDLAVKARRDATAARVRGLAAQREAQGHALAGDDRACRVSLDDARELLALPADTAGHPTVGTNNVADQAAMTTGWCLYDLGWHREAAGVLDAECRRLPPEAHRSRLRYGIRRALAHAASGEIEHACGIAGELLGGIASIRSATIRTDIVRLDCALAGFRANRAVRELRPHLDGALRRTSTS